MSGQMSLFDAAEPMNRPRYLEGDAIYRVVLDVVEEFTVSGNFSMGMDVFGERTEAGRTLWRYWLDGKDGREHAVFGEYEMGGRWFDDKESAYELAVKNRWVIDNNALAMRAYLMLPIKPVAYVIEREGSFPVICQTARLGERAAFEQRPYCYPFVRLFATEKETVACYLKLARELAAEGGEPTAFCPKDVYRINDRLWAGYEYAERHSDWSALHDGLRPPPRQQPANGSAPVQKKKKTKSYER
ncbi:MAG: hypothetical protein LBJ48_00275 [Coriobacteriales bacterium]|jgi:hypothetical protein|nr:hypothetical protein [Coriobacteriales bacterium]